MFICSQDICHLVCGNYFRLDSFKTGNIFTSTGLNSIEKEMTYLFVTATFFHVWMERNSRLHNPNLRRGASGLTEEIKLAVRHKLFTCTYFQRNVRADHSIIMRIY